MPVQVLRELPWLRSFSGVQHITEDLYKKYFNDPDNHNGVISHLEADILECEVK